MGAVITVAITAVQAVLTTPSFDWAAFGLVSLLLFRPQLRNLLGRATSVGPAGITAAPEAAQQQPVPGAEHGGLAPSPPAALGAAPTPPAVNPHEAAEQILGAFHDPHVIAEEDKIRKDLTDRALGPATPDGQRVLLRLAAGWYVMSDFERIFEAIFGSQIVLLRALNIAAATDGEIEGAHQIPAQTYAAIYEQFPTDRWLGSCW